jgi:hypothetical protein
MMRGVDGGGGGLRSPALGFEVEMDADASGEGIVVVVLMVIGLKDVVREDVDWVDEVLGVISAGDGAVLSVDCKELLELASSIVLGFPGGICGCVF